MALRELDTILLKRKTGVDSFAENTYSAQESVSARWNDEQQLTKDEKGLEFTSNSTIYYLDSTKFKTGDVVKLNGSSDDFRPIRKIAKHRNGAGTRFLNIAYLDNAFR